MKQKRSEKSMGHREKFTDKEVELLANSKATTTSEFAQEYVKKFGQPKNYLRPASLFGKRKHILERYKKEQQKKLKKQLVEAGKKSQGTPAKETAKKPADSLPDEGVTLVKILNTLVLIKEIIEGCAKVQKEAHAFLKESDGRNKPHP